MLQDLRYSARALVKSPSYSVIALLVLALGIGANTAIFSFVDALLLRPLPYPHADRLYVPISLNPSRGSNRVNITWADYEDWRRETDVFAAVAIANPATVDLTGTNEPERVDASTVSEEYFALTDVKPLAGRGLQPADHDARAPRVTVISFGLWQRRFAGAPDVVGREIRIGGVPTTVVGVLPPRASWPEDRDLFLPLRSSLLNADVRTRRDNMIFQGLARLADGATREQAEARMRTIAARLEQQFPESRRGWSNRLVPLREYALEPEMRMALVVLAGAVGAVLLIGCANLASLALVRGAGRAREIGVRLALGASRRRVIRQLLVESVLLASVGGLLGVLAAGLMVEALRGALPADVPFVNQVGIDLRVLTAAGALSLITTVLFGIMPALTASAVRVTDALSEASRGASHGRRTSRLRGILVVGEIAAAVVLLVGAGLLVRSLAKLTAEVPGADIDRVLAGQLSLPGSRYPLPAFRAEFVRQLTARLGAEPNVEAAAITTYLPVGGGGFGLGRVFLAEGWPEPPAGRDVPAMWTVVSPDYFRALGIPLKSGRVFTDRDNENAPPVIVIGETVARSIGEPNPIGRRIRSWRDENVLRQIVGIVADVPFESLSDRGTGIVYIPHAQDSWGLLTVAVRAANGRPDTLAGTLRRGVAAIDPNLALARVGTMSVFARTSIARERVSTILMSVLAMSALTLAALGIYGVLSYSVTERRREMGVRLALGASPADLYRSVVTRGLGLTATGLAAGLAIALGGARLIGRLLYGTSPFDPVAFAGTAATLALVALVACLMPARRAATADPMGVLRSE